MGLAWLEVGQEDLIETAKKERSEIRLQSLMENKKDKKKQKKRECAIFGCTNHRECGTKYLRMCTEHYQLLAAKPKVRKVRKVRKVPKPKVPKAPEVPKVPSMLPDTPSMRNLFLSNHKWHGAPLNPTLFCPATDEEPETYAGVYRGKHPVGEHPFRMKKRARKKTKKTTRYNMFVAAHVKKLKLTQDKFAPGPGETTRLVASAWRQLSEEEKQQYEV